VSKPHPRPHLQQRLADLHALLRPPLRGDGEIVMVRWWRHVTHDPALHGMGIETVSAALIEAVCLGMTHLVLVSQAYPPQDQPRVIPIADIIDLDHKSAQAFTSGDMFDFQSEPDHG